jgi:hypothetical protein
VSGSLAEIMGKKGAAKSDSLEMGDLKELLGDGMPEMKFDPVGRIRLVKALHQRFGEGYRSIPGVKNIMKEFDDRVSFDVKVRRMKSLGKR